MALAHPASAIPSQVAPHRVMVVDDSSVVRGLVSRWVGASPGFEIAALACNGRVALSLLDEARPDIVLLDLDMPEMDGLATLPRLLEQRPGTSVIVVSTLTRRNAEISLRCLSLGAVDYLTKPGSGQSEASSADFQREIMARLNAIASARAPSNAPIGRERAEPVPSLLAARVASPPRIGVPLSAGHRRCLVIGASTGGPLALTRLLGDVAHLTAHLPILVVQHMPPVFTKVFAEQIAKATGLRAREGEAGERVEAGRVYIAAGGSHMGLAASEGDVTIRLDRGPPIHHCRPAVDVLFGDAARVFGAGTLGIVLTGMGSDGTEGARALVAAGATMFAQDEATSTVWGMPGNVVRAGLARAVLPLHEIGPAISIATALGRRTM